MVGHRVYEDGRVESFFEFLIVWETRVSNTST